MLYGEPLAILASFTKPLVVDCSVVSRQRNAGGGTLDSSSILCKFSRTSSWDSSLWCSRRFSQRKNAKTNIIPTVTSVETVMITSFLTGFGGGGALAAGLATDVPMSGKGGG